MSNPVVGGVELDRASLALIFGNGLRYLQNPTEDGKKAFDQDILHLGKMLKTLPASKNDPTK